MKDGDRCPPSFCLFNPQMPTRAGPDQSARSIGLQLDLFCGGSDTSIWATTGCLLECRAAGKQGSQDSAGPSNVGFLSSNIPAAQTSTLDVTVLKGLQWCWYCGVSGKATTYDACILYRRWVMSWLPYSQSCSLNMFLGKVAEDGPNALAPEAMWKT